MKISEKLSIIIAAIAFYGILTQCGNPQTYRNGFPAQWIFMEQNTPLYACRWTSGNHVINAMNGSPAYITAVRDISRKNTPFKYQDINGKPFVSTLCEDDFLLFSIPASRLEKGSFIEIEATIVSNPDSPKYFIIEYMESGKWKSNPEDLRPIPEKPEMKYSFACSGIGTGENHEYTSVYQTFRLAKAIRGGELKIRFRATGGITCSGKPQDAQSPDGAIGFAGHGFNGAGIQNYGTSVPSDTTRILCLGNSFTYFSNSPSMLKEIAWSQGHYFNIKAHLKGGRTLGQHAGLILTGHEISYGNYDMAILQDQSQNPARYASEPEKYGNVPQDYLALSGMVLKHSPGCRIIMEQTWAYPSQNFGGFGDYNAFTGLLYKGAYTMAEQNGGEVSPIGEAFETVFRENRDIRLYDTDNKHQSHYGSYLKACVNYLVITGQEFSGEPADCGLEPEKAEYLRNVAERAVFH